jgi:hypothetical protein
VKILILGANQRKRYNWGHQLFKDEIARQHNVRFYGEGHHAWDPKDRDIRSILRRLEFNPDMILSYMGKYCRWIEGMERLDIPKSHIIIDYFRHNYDEEDDFIKATKQDLVFAVCQHETRALARNGFKGKIAWLPFSIDTDVFRYKGEKKTTDVMAVFSVVQWAYPTRNEILCTIKDIQENQVRMDCLLQASWPKTRLLHDDYVQALAHSKIVVNGVDHYGSVNWKFFEPCACGSLLMTERGEDMDELGFVDGLTCVTFNGMDNLRSKILKYLKEETLRREIAGRGYLLIQEKHSNKQRVKEMTETLKIELGVGD